MPNRLTGLCLVDVGPVIDMSGLQVVLDFLGRNPVWRTHVEAAEVFGERIAGFANVPEGRWAEEVAKHFIETPDGLIINYDPQVARRGVGKPLPKRHPTCGPCSRCAVDVRWR